MIQTIVSALSALAVSAGLGAHPASPPAPADAHRLREEYLAHQETERADPTPPPAAPPVAVSIPDVIRAAFRPLGDGAVTWAERVAWCESRYDPQAVNPQTDAEGLFQFLPSTWRATPFASASPFDPAANARAAAWLYARYGPEQWECQA